MLRRLKKDVIKELPTKSESILRVGMSDMQVGSSCVLSVTFTTWVANAVLPGLQMKWYKNILTKVRCILVLALELSELILGFELPPELSSIEPGSWPRLAHEHCHGTQKGRQSSLSV